MKHIYLTIITISILFTACNQREYSNPGPSLIYLSFNNEVTNSGILPVEFRGDKYVSYTKGIRDTCLDLTGNALYRKPVIIDKGPANSFGDYEGLSLLFWVKSDPYDPMEYVLAGQQVFLENNQYQGWNISKTGNGGWQWEFSDGLNKLAYTPLSKHQPIDDGKWHQIGFAIDKRQLEARFYYDGNLKAVMSLETLDFAFPGTALYIGAAPIAEDPRIETFNGMIDELGVWSRVLTDAQVAGTYRNIADKKLRSLPEYSDSVTVMTWNIANGGKMDGKYVGLQRIADVIRDSGADIISLQESLGAGETIAGELGYYLYRRSKNLSILSRFPPAKSFNVYRPDHFGALEIAIDETKHIIIAPIWLSQNPNLSAYFQKSDARADTIEVREMETRGREANFMLSEIRPFLLNAQQTPVILAGNFNSGSHLDWTERNQENHNGLVVHFPATRFIEEAGFSDAYRTIFPDEVNIPGHTWSPIYKEGLQTRMDFIFFQGDALIPSTTRVIDTTTYGFPSDHAAVVVSFLVSSEF
jgi:endonuclease/exonuclease/phosphatase family metal-dependent hydrolase